MISVLNQSLNSTVFSIVRFLEGAKTVLSGDSLYYLELLYLTLITDSTYWEYYRARYYRFIIALGGGERSKVFLFCQLNSLSCHWEVVNHIHSLLVTIHWLLTHLCCFKHKRTLFTARPIYYIFYSNSTIRLK